MLRWGDTQSIFQVTLALNLAYFSFREIRAPVHNKWLRDLTQLQDECLRIKNRLSTIEKPNYRPSDIKNLDDKEKNIYLWNCYNAKQKYEAELDVHLYNSGFIYKDMDFDDDRIDALQQYASIVMAICGFLVLLHASLHASDPLNPLWFLLFAIVTLLPTMFVLFVNLSVVWFIRSGRHYLASSKSLVKSIDEKIESDLLPGYEKAIGRTSTNPQVAGRDELLRPTRTSFWR
jgi:hypothetical protein